MKALLVSLALAVTAALHADGGSYLALASLRPAESPVSISVPAQYLAAEVRIEYDEEDWATKLSGIEEARRMLAAAAAREGFTVRVEQALVLSAGYGQAGSSKLSISQFRGGQEAVSEVLLLAPLSEKSELIPIVKKYRDILAGLKPSRKVRVSLGGISLGLENPEAWRTELLKKIRVHVESSAKLLSDAPDYHVSGLDEPVRVRQKGERELEVFLPFRVTYGQRK